MTPTKKTTVAPEPTLQERITRLMRARELGKRHYGRADRIMDELLKVMTPGEPIAMPGGKKAVLTDLYAAKNKVFRSHGIARYELELVDAD